jgi:hypothetical protein
MKRFYPLIVAFSSLFSDRIDVVIPLHQKDRNSASFVIENLENKVKDIGKIYIISKERLSTKAEWIDEALLPFSLEDVARETNVTNDKRCGWYFQQLIKFYAHTIIENLSENFLVFDGDTKPNHQMEFINEDGKIYLDRLKDICRCRYYYSHMYKMLPDLKEVDLKVNPVVHHMVFSKEILQDLFSKVEERVNQPFWKEFLHSVTLIKGKLPYVGASEYMIYYHFCKNYHQDKVVDRIVKVYNHAHNFTYPYDPKKYDFISVHTYL